MARISERRLWFPFYVDHWLGSSDIMLMGPAGEGAYIRLLALAWGQPDCGLPADDESLAVLSRLGEREWKGRVGRLIRSKFREENGRLYSDRLLDEFNSATEKMQKASESGRASGAARRERSLQRSFNERSTTVERTFNELRTDGELEQNRTEIPPPTPSRRGRKVDESLVEQFHQWFELYPKKVKGDTAFQAWISLCDLGEITADNVRDVFAGLERYKRSELWARDGGKYVPEPVAFLVGNEKHKGRLWKDFPPASAAAQAAERRLVESADGGDAFAVWVPSWRSAEEEAAEAERGAA